MFTQTITYGLSKQLNFKPFPDELPRFYLASWK
jgi:peptide/nickel transport system substrate-binding protein